MVKEAVRFVAGGEDDHVQADPLHLGEGNRPLEPQYFGGVAGAGDDHPFTFRDKRLAE
jgi:hypothetical protein